ncbi:hypothetical protein K505DRAFT_335026 [Melanomma pulvis-pyrius CBS 109.77]|uniref:Uncharacterized protein n=1 Tax=Melanomma pulvis-pyrius CBS 109.77 TaxID=1314802 RepID=A0A6A6XKA0_9PLEO|nr:hypothetical protein K505DRAFT_335026 [Melanomma pulvis-pyrius CBS 109.77]
MLEPIATAPKLLQIHSVDGTLLTRRENLLHHDVNFRYGAPLSTIHRVDLQAELLLKTMDSGATILYSSRNSNIDSSGPETQLANGEKHSGDLIVVGDGTSPGSYPIGYPVQGGRQFCVQLVVSDGPYQQGSNPSAIVTELRMRFEAWDSVNFAVIEALDVIPATDKNSQVENCAQCRRESKQMAAMHEIGSAAIPGVGKAITVGMKIRNGVGNHAREAGCKTPFLFSKADIAKRFLDFADAMDELVPGVKFDEMPCPKGKKVSKKAKRRIVRKTTMTLHRAQKTAPNQPRPAISPCPQQLMLGPMAKADCLAIGRNDMEALLEIASDVEGEGLAEKRAVVTTLQSRRLEARSFRPKSGDTCQKSKLTQMPSKEYPSSGENVMIRNFFNTVNDHADFKAGEYLDHENTKTELKDPADPEGEKESWDWPSTLKMQNPDPAAPAPVVGSEPLTQTPFQRFAETYHFIDRKTATMKQAHENEFILLQKLINQIQRIIRWQIYNNNVMKDIIPPKGVVTRSSRGEKERLIRRSTKALAKNPTTVESKSNKPKKDATYKFRTVIFSKLEPQKL